MFVANCSNSLAPIRMQRGRGLFGDGLACCVRQTWQIRRNLSDGVILAKASADGFTEK